MCIHWNPLRELTSPRQRNDVRSRYESPYLFRERIVRYSCPSLPQSKKGAFTFFALLGLRVVCLLASFSLPMMIAIVTSVLLSVG